MSMSNLEIAESLGELMQLDVNAAGAYDQAMQYVELISLRDRFAQFRNMHEQQATSLEKVIRALDVIPPSRTSDFKGILMESWAVLRGGMGAEGALRAMKTNAEYVAKKYREASALPFSANIGTLVERNYRNSNAHLQFIEKAIANRVWEKKVA